MKKIKSTVLLFSLLVVSLGACKKDDNEDVREEVFSSDLTFKLDGAAKKSTLVVCVKDEEVQGEESLGLVASIGNSESLTIAFDDIPTVGNYNVANNENVVVAYQNGSNPATDIYVSETGTVKITSISDKEIKGTFEISAQNSAEATKTISEGKFSAKIVDAD